MKKSVVIAATTTEARHNAVLSFFSQFPEGKAIYMSAEDRPPSREKVQGDLLMVWNRQVAKWAAMEEWEVHASMKLQILLDMKLYGFDGKYREEALVENQLMHDVQSIKHTYSDPEFIVNRVAYNNINSKGLGVKYFAEYLTKYEQYFNERGLKFTISEKTYQKAIYGK